CHAARARVVRCRGRGCALPSPSPRTPAPLPSPLHNALPICMRPRHAELFATDLDDATLIKYIDRFLMFYVRTADRLQRTSVWRRSEEHTSELQSRGNLVCRLLLEKKQRGPICVVPQPAPKYA